VIVQLLAAAAGVPGSCSVAYIYYKFFLSLSSSAPFELCLLGRKIKVRNSPLGQKKKIIYRTHLSGWTLPPLHFRP